MEAPEMRQHLGRIGWVVAGALVLAFMNLEGQLRSYAFMATIFWMFLCATYSTTANNPSTPTRKVFLNCVKYSALIALLGAAFHEEPMYDFDGNEIDEGTNPTSMERLDAGIFLFVEALLGTTLGALIAVTMRKR